MTKQYGDNPIAKLNTPIGAALLYETIEIRITSRPIDQLRAEASERLLQQIFNASLVAYVDGARDAGKGIKESILAFLQKNDISEDEMPLNQALKLYDRKRSDRKQ